MDIIERNRKLCELYKSGMTLKQISEMCGLSMTQLSRIFREHGATRKKYELDRDYFEKNKDKTKRQISEETGIPLRRVQYLYNVAYDKVPHTTRNATDFRGRQPLVDPRLINDPKWLHEQYVVNRHGGPWIAKQLAVHTRDVYRAFKKYGIKRRNVKEAALIKNNRPAAIWFHEHYIEKKWSIEKCARELGLSWNSVYASLEYYGIPIRTASEQHVGELNEFYGKHHNDETKMLCAQIGAKHGALYWTTGDIEVKKKLVSEMSKKVWSDPLKRMESSQKISELCKQGKCNAKKHFFARQDGSIIYLKSSWELLVAQILDMAPMVAGWAYESVSIPYLDGEIIKNFVIDFWVKWKDGLETMVECKNQFLSDKSSEQLKLAALEQYGRRHGIEVIIISKKEEIRKLARGYKDLVRWANPTRYKVSKTYLEEPELFVKMMLHDITSRICPWKPLQYEEDELHKDWERLNKERIHLYIHTDSFRATIPNGGGMPGRMIMTHFNPHFWDVPPKNYQPLSEAFSHAELIYKCLNTSYREQESLSTERLLREINFHSNKHGRTSHFAPGFARAVIRDAGMSGAHIFDPCCGWGGRLIGAALEKCQYSGYELSPQTFAGLTAISKFIGFDADLRLGSCLEADWPKANLIFTSPPFYNIEHYIGGEQPWKIFPNRNAWRDGFVRSFIEHINTKTILYLDHKTKDDFEQYRKFDKIVPVQNKRHVRHRRPTTELLCYYK